ncbi:serine/threonine-protein kinase [Luteolibacter algae]|uniref:Serine/threonine-protein kinase n=1 Tax=Luteolibacter algae TaxID=454151 RepID=A0ABW5D6E3_9BACT
MSEHEHQAAFEAPSLEEVAQLFPSYDVHSLIACGGMGAVYQASQRSLERGVAIKILPREFSRDAEFTAGFEAEAKAMAKLNHPNLIGVYDFGEVDGMLYIVMEYVAGSSLYQAADGQAVEQSEALRIVSAVCHGLHHAHQAGILHRDIKPANILLDGNLNPKIGDFGLARPLENQIQEGEQIFGTPGYTAPEVIEPPYTIDHRADIFSVGVMLHELLTGKLPAADPRPPSHISACNPRLDAVIKKATHPDPNSRYHTAEELAAELEKIASSPAKAILTTGAAAAAGRPFVAPKPVKQSSSSGLGALVALLVIAAGIAYFVTNRKAPEATPVAEEKPRERVIEIPAPKVVEEPEPEPEIVEEPEPEPAAVIEKPKPKPKPEPAALEPEPEPSVPAKFNVVEFLDKAKGIMVKRVSSELSSYKSSVSDNTTEFADTLDRLIRKADPTVRAAAENSLDENREEWTEAGNELPAELPEALAAVADAEEIHSQYLEKQTVLQEILYKKLDEEAAVYIVGLEKQIERLEGENDPGAIELFNRQIAKVKASPDFYRALIMK